MDRAALKTALMRYGFDTTDPLDTWINAARNELVTDLPLSVLDEDFTFSTNAGDADLSDNLPADFFKVIELIDTTNVTENAALDYMDYRKFRRDVPQPTLTGLPTIYTVQNLNQIRIYPVPTSTRTWLLLYQRLVTDLTADGNSPSELPTQFHYIIVYRAAAIALAAENEEDRAQAAMTEYATALEKLIMAYNQRQMGSFETVQDEMGYSGF